MFGAHYITKLLFLLNIFWIKTHCKLFFSFSTIRHGARTPFSPTPDILGEFWSIDPTHNSQLTEIGQWQGYWLGTFFQNRYKTWISSQYKSNEILVKTSNLHRCINTARAFLLGFYPEKSGSRWQDMVLNKALPPIYNDNFDFEYQIANWGVNSLPHGVQLVPITVYDSIDWYETCPGIAKVLSQHWHSEKWVNEVKVFNDIYGEKLRQVLGVEMKDTFWYLKNITKLCDTFISDYLHQRELAVFKNTGIDLHEFNATCYHYLKVDNYEYFASNIELLRVYSNELLHSLIEYLKNIKNKSKEDYNQLKVVVNVSHDYNWSALLELFRVYFNTKNERIYPIYASSIIFDVLDDEDEKGFRVNVDFNGMNILSKDWNSFIDVLEGIKMSDEEVNHFCFNSWSVKINDSSINYYLMFALVFGLMSLFEFVIIFKQIKRNRRRGKQLHAEELI